MAPVIGNGGGRRPDVPPGHADPDMGMEGRALAEEARRSREAVHSCRDQLPAYMAEMRWLRDQLPDSDDQLALLASAVLVLLELALETPATSR